MLRELISKKRKEKQLTQAALAKKIGIRTATLSDYENGKTAISADTVEKIFKVLNIELQVYEDLRLKTWDDSLKVAEVLHEKKVKIDTLTKREVYDLTGIEIVLMLKEVSEKIYDEYALKRIISEEETYNYFKSLVSFHTSFLRDKK